MLQSLSVLNCRATRSSLTPTSRGNILGQAPAINARHIQRKQIAAMSNQPLQTSITNQPRLPVGAIIGPLRLMLPMQKSERISAHIHRCAFFCKDLGYFVNLIFIHIYPVCLLPEKSYSAYGSISNYRMCKACSCGCNMSHTVKLSLLDVLYFCLYISLF